MLRISSNQSTNQSHRYYLHFINIYLTLIDNAMSYHSKNLNYCRKKQKMKVEHDVFALLWCSMLPSRGLFDLVFMLQAMFTCSVRFHPTKTSLCVHYGKTEINYWLLIQFSLSFYIDQIQFKCLCSTILKHHAVWDVI